MVTYYARLVLSKRFDNHAFVRFVDSVFHLAKFIKPGLTLNFSFRARFGESGQPLNGLLSSRPLRGQTNFLLSENLIEVYLINKSNIPPADTFDLKSSEIGEAVL